jgi:hypothetical protein
MLRKSFFIMILLVPFAAKAGSTNGFDTDELARFAKVNTAIGFIQDSNTLADAKALSMRAKKFRKNNQSRKMASVANHYFNHVLAVGLSDTEMQNLSVSAGDKIEVMVQAGNRTQAYVYRANGAYRPPESTVNLSLAAARKLHASPGDQVILRKLSSDVAAVPRISKKPL